MADVPMDPDLKNMSSRLSTALLILLVVSGTLNVVLAFRVFSYERALHPTPRVRAGTHLTDIIGAYPDGLPTIVRFSDSREPTVLLILRPGCSWCTTNMPDWQALIRAKHQSFRFVAVTLSPVGFKQYLKENGLDIVAVSLSLDKNPTLSSVTATPQTIVVGNDGTVRRVWMGAFTREIKGEVEAFFSVTLPVEVGTMG